MEERIQQRLEELTEQRDAIRIDSESYPENSTERKRLGKKFSDISEAVKYLEKGPSEEFIKQEIETAFKKIEIRGLEKQRVEEELANRHISKDVYDEKIASLTDKLYKKQIKFLRAILPKN